MRDQQTPLEPYLDRIKALAFVKGLRVHRHRDHEVDGKIEIRTPGGTYVLAYELKHAYLGEGITNATIAFAKTIKKKYGLNTIVLAPYLPRPTGERLVDAGVNFVDRYGNLHIDLRGRYQVMVLGVLRNDRIAERRRAGPATVQALFVHLAEPRAANWPVRKIAEAAGVGKTIVADVRRRLVQDGILVKVPGRRYRIVDQKQLEQRWLVGYGELLRPRMLIGTYRTLHEDEEAFVREFARKWRDEYGGWALTGAAAAYALQRFYRGKRTQILVTGLPTDLLRELRLVKDGHGPITILKTFEPRVTWKRIGALRVAHPWLIYAELLMDPNPRALEAAEKFRQEFLEPQ